MSCFLVVFSCSIVTVRIPFHAPPQPDHLDRHGTMESYGRAKCGIFARMGPRDLAVLPEGDPLLARLAAEAGGSPSRAYLGALPGAMYDPEQKACLLRLPPGCWGSSAGGGGGKEGEEWGSSLSLSLAPLRALGEHNARNACAAALIATGLGVVRLCFFFLPLPFSAFSSFSLLPYSFPLPSFPCPAFTRTFAPPLAGCSRRSFISSSAHARNRCTPLPSICDKKTVSRIRHPAHPFPNMFFSPHPGAGHPC